MPGDPSGEGEMREGDLDAPPFPVGGIRAIEIKGDTEGRIVRRENRFLCTVSLGGTEVLAHLHDPGRLRELVYPGAEVLLRRAPGDKRRTEWDILAAGAEKARETAAPLMDEVRKAVGIR